MADSELLKAQKLFARCFSLLMIFIQLKGWEMTFAEGFVGDSINKPGEDSPHRRDGGHFRRTAIDINLFVAGSLVTQSSHPAYIELEKFWMSLNPLCRTGGANDRNHFGILFAGVA
jgi:hypothetical protein